MTLFDRYVAIDWSAAAIPKQGADSIWVADLIDGGQTGLANHRTRLDAAAWLDDLADGAQQRVLVGVDAGLGYPQGAAAHFGLEGVPWRSLWAAIAERSSDDDRNRNNRFDVAASLNSLGTGGPGPFWGSVDDSREPILRRTKPTSFDVPEFRIVEQRARDLGRFPKSVWQLLGAGSVGSQTLTFLPILVRLLDRVAVWPFTTGLRAPEAVAGVVIVEIWPSWFVDRGPPGIIPDAAQVAGTVAALSAADAAGDLAAWFAPRVDDERPIIDEEGWMLGVG